MRNLLIFPAALILAGGSSPVDDTGALEWRQLGQVSAPEQPRFTIRAGPVDHAEAAAVSGTFQVHRTGAPDGIASSRLAGGCLEFLAADLGFTQMAAKQCQKNSDCSVPGENEFGACDTETNQCWAKPAGLAAGAALCNRGLIAPVNELIPVPRQPADVRQFGIQPGARVRVGACLNRSGINPQATGCLSADGADKVQVWGPVTEIR